ncbi:unnamed protein product [Polarella glacialis]|uniref:Uncharacterized protein n=1 Tax=Polarella glacialis TaxID=89957 RepID=A0A813G4T9_POLGL|nr:unnamed protein product [Polarella glacialis]
MTAAAAEAHGCTGGSVRTGRRRDLRKLHGGRLHQSLFVADLYLQGLRRIVEGLQLSLAESKGGSISTPLYGAIIWTRVQLLQARRPPEVATTSQVIFSLQPRTHTQDSPQPVPSCSNRCWRPTLVGEDPLRVGLVAPCAPANAEAVPTAPLKSATPRERSACHLVPVVLDLTVLDRKAPILASIVSTKVLDVSDVRCLGALCANCNLIAKRPRLYQSFGCPDHGWCSQAGTLDDSTLFWVRPSTGMSKTQRELLEEVVAWVKQSDSGEARAATAGDEARLRTAVAGLLALANVHLTSRGLPRTTLSAWQGAKENFEDLFGSLNLTYLRPVEEGSDTTQSEAGANQEDAELSQGSTFATTLGPLSFGYNDWDQAALSAGQGCYILVLKQPFIEFWREAVNPILVTSCCTRLTDGIS